MPDFGDPRTGEGERKVPPGAVYRRRRKGQIIRRRRRRKNPLGDPQNPTSGTDGRRWT